MAELYLQELRYQLGEDPDPWIAKLQRVQEAFGYDDAKMVLLVEMCVQKPVTEFVRQLSRTSRVQEVYAGFRRLHELCKRVDSERAFKWAMLHVGCKGKHNPRNVVLDKKASLSSLSSSSELEEEISMTGETEVLRFPENSFPIRCGYGDFCVNDVLKFDQTLVYNNVSLKEGIVGKAYKRTIVGRVAHEAEGVEVIPTTRNSTTRMSESFSQSDEEPTYAIEVYWSRGVKPVSTSEPFVIKAHSLKLLKPVRQRWGNEQNRVHEMEKKQSKLGSARAKSRALQTSCRRLSAANRRSRRLSAANLQKTRVLIESCLTQHAPSWPSADPKIQARHKCTSSEIHGITGSSYRPSTLLSLGARKAVSWGLHTQVQQSTSQSSETTNHAF